MMHLPNMSVPSLKTDVESMSSLNNINVQNAKNLHGLWIAPWTLNTMQSSLTFPLLL